MSLHDKINEQVELASLGYVGHTTATDRILALVRDHLGSGSGPDLSSSDPEPDTRWQHRNGNVYQVVLITNLPDEERYPKTVVYQNVSNGTYWSRRANDWHRSFVRVG